MHVRTVVTSIAVVQLMIMKLSNLAKTQHDSDTESDEDEDEEETGGNAILEHREVRHRGAVNRVR